MIGISICILTYKREEFLGELLHSLSLQQALDQFDIEVVVVDTSGERTAESVVHQSAVANFSIYVGSESRESIPAGRNLALDTASKDWIFFIDDDQYFDTQIMGALYERLKALPDNVVIAKLGVVVDYEVENWTKDLSTFNRDIPFEDGEEFAADCVSTDGVLFSRELAVDRGIIFDQFWASDGGEDNDFFARLLEGDEVVISWSSLKLVDRVMKDRMTIRYCIRDAYRKGLCRFQLRARVHKVRPSHLLFISILMLVFCIIVTPFSFLRGRITGWNSVLKTCRQAGKLGGLLGMNLGMYEKPSNISF